MTEEPEASQIITFHANRLKAEDGSYRCCHHRKINKHKSWHTWENTHGRKFLQVPQAQENLQAQFKLCLKPKQIYQKTHIHREINLIYSKSPQVNFGFTQCNILIRFACELQDSNKSQANRFCNKFLGGLIQKVFLFSFQLFPHLCESKFTQ